MEVDQTAKEQMETLTRQLAAAEGVTESLKARDSLSWIQRMNSIRNRAEEVVLHEVVYEEQLN